MPDEWKIRPSSGGACWYPACGAPVRFEGLWRHVQGTKTYYQAWKLCHAHGKGWAEAKALEFPWPDPKPIAYPRREPTPRDAPTLRRLWRDDPQRRQARRQAAAQEGMRQGFWGWLRGKGDA